MSDPLKEWRDQLESVRRMTESPALRELQAHREEIQRTFDRLQASVQLPPELLAQREQIQRTLDQLKVSIPPELVEQQRQHRQLLEELNAKVHLLESFGGPGSREVVGSTLPTNITSSTFFSRKSSREAELEREALALKEELSALRQELEAEIQSGQAREATFSQYAAKHYELLQNEKVQFILSRISSDAGRIFVDSQAYREEFIEERDCLAYVMSIDLRRSTDLMLKAREPRLYAKFITGLSELLRRVVFAHHGVFDKFTGDGILAYFPEFHTGDDAGYHAVMAATESHDVFEHHYREHRLSFNAVLSPRDIGLGIGIDYGAIYLADAGPEIAIVGTPVVYACRMSGTQAGRTLLNQPAYEKIAERWPGACVLQEDEVEVKREGHYVAYRVSLNAHHVYTPAGPGWTKYESVHVEDEPPTSPPAPTSS
jgi:adenylate cyclase